MDFQIPIQLIIVLVSWTLAMDYDKIREDFLAKEYLHTVSGKINLTAVEEQANKVLMDAVSRERYGGVGDPANYVPLLPADEFVRRVPFTKVFQLLQEMPKGALLHMHDIGMSSYEYIQRVTHRRNLWVCEDPDKEYQLKFFHVPDDTCNWILAKTKFEQDPSYDEFLKDKLSFIRPHPYTMDIYAFRQFATLYIGLLGQNMVFAEYITQTLTEIYDDGIRYAEVRSWMPYLYDCMGNIYDRDYMVNIYKQQVAKFQKKHPDFIGLKIIFTLPRNASPSELFIRLQEYTALKEKYGSLILGIDFEDNEDYTQPLKNLAETLIEYRKSNSVELYLHAGVTAWLGVFSDENLFDALLLNARRIAHDYALPKHPLLMKEFKSKGICVEVAPIVDHFHALYTNIHENILSQLEAYDMPFVLTGGNPGVYNAKGVTYDWYLAFMGMCSARDDLRYLKIMALNSIKYSGLSQNEKDNFEASFHNDWDVYIHKIINDDILA